MDDTPTTNESRTRVLAIAEAVYRVTAISHFDAELSRALRAGALSLALAVLGKKSAERIHRESRTLIDLLTLGVRTGYISEDAGGRIARACRAFINESEAREEEKNEALRLEEPGSIIESEEDEETGAIPSERIASSFRQQRIADFIQSQGRAKISEIYTLFQDVCSEKTIQRDLGDLVERGLIRREGDHRWTTYISISDIS